MYNNLSQQTPYMSYGYGMTSYQRLMPQDNQQAQIPNQNAPLSYQQAPSMMQNFIKGRPVVSIDEARASQIDLDGSLYVFPDLGNKRIYTKQINMDGTASFNVFNLSEASEQSSTSSYVTKEELNAILEKFKASLSEPAAEAKSAPAPTSSKPSSFNL